jgi:hypothetical protein
MEKFIKKMDKLENKNNNNENDNNKNDDNKKKLIEENNINDITLIKNSFEYYDKNCEKNVNKFDKVHYISYQLNINDLEHDVIIFYDTNFKELFKSRIEKIGIFDKISHIWIWAWAVSSFKKNETNIARKILQYGTELDPSTSFLKTELITSRFRISNKIQLDMHCAIASYLSKKTQIFKYTIFNLLKIIDNKYIDIISPDYSKNEDVTFELEYYVFLLDEI